MRTPRASRPARSTTVESIIQARQRLKKLVLAMRGSHVIAAVVVGEGTAAPSVVYAATGAVGHPNPSRSPPSVDALLASTLLAAASVSAASSAAAGAPPGMLARIRAAASAAAAQFAPPAAGAAQRRCCLASWASGASGASTVALSRTQAGSVAA